MADESNNNVIVSRIQHRRGLKQDLPQPLRPGEIGLATDSRQVYIGGDPSDPASEAFNSVSYFENTVSARDHTISIANNQIIAFQVPFVKFTRGEFNGISDSKGWQPTDARSIISYDANNSSKCDYTSSKYTVFSNVTTATIVHTANANIDGSTLTVIDTGTDETGNIRIGDRVTGNGISGSNVVVSAVSADAGNGNLIVTLDKSGHSVTSGSNVNFIPQQSLNFFNYDPPPAGSTYATIQSKFATASFKSTDVIVRKNGIKLIAETDSTATSPTATSDYALDASNVSSTGIQYVTLRTRPSSSEDLSVCYYSNANVIQALDGVSSGTSVGKISVGSPLNSFYSDKDIPDYRKIPSENIRVSETTGLGYIGLQQKHIVSVANGANISTPGNVALGNILTSRVDQSVNVANVEASYDANTNVNTVTFHLSNVEDNIFVSTSETGVYGYGRIYVETDLAQFSGIDETVIELTSSGNTSIVAELAGNVVGDQSNTAGSNFDVASVLSIDLSANTTVQSATATVNKELVTVNSGNSNVSVANVTLYPYLDFSPQTDGNKNQVFFSEKPSFTSVDVGGVPFRLHEDSANTLAAIGLTAGTYDRTSSVKAKLEDWMNTLVTSRDTNLFVNIFTGGEVYANLTGIANNFTNYNLIINDTEGEIQFCDRQESEHFNYITNSAYSESPYDRAEDSTDGTRGLVNLKNNLEIQTREAATVGKKVTTFTSMETIVVSEGVTFDEEIFRLSVESYNTFVLDYSFVEQDNEDVAYMRSGTILVTARPDAFADGNTAVVFRDTFNSQTEGVTGTTLEPKFQANVNTTDDAIIFSFAEQNNPNGSGTMAHNLNSKLRLKYIVKRWSSTA